MNRRGFLGIFAGALAAATLDPERALWIPGAKTISIPKPNTEMVTWFMSEGELHQMRAAVSWKAIVNDDLGTFTYLTQRMARSAQKTFKIQIDAVDIVRCR